MIARDAELDLALLRVKNAPPGLRPLPIGNSEEVDIGENGDANLTSHGSKTLASDQTLTID